MSKEWSFPLGSFHVFCNSQLLTPCWCWHSSIRINANRDYRLYHFAVIALNSGLLPSCQNKELFKIKQSKTNEIIRFCFAIS